MSMCKAVVLAVILALCTGISRGQCPASCYCERTVVRCSSQQLLTMPLSLPDATIILELADNKIASLPADAFQGLSNLEKLYLWGNRLRNISRATLRGLAKLRILSLSSNQLESIDDGAFEGMPDLYELYLSNNRLGNIPRAAFSGLTKLSTLTLSNNPLICDCQLRWLIETVHDSQSKLKVFGAVCEVPAHLQGRDIVNVTQADLNCSTQANAIDFGLYGAEESVKTETNFFVKCKLNSSIPSADMATYKWFKVDNTEVTSREYITRVYVVDRSPGLELNLEPVQDEDAGRYRCVASVGGQTYERPLFLTVRATITFNDCPTEQFGVVGHRSEIWCSASGGEGTLSTEWRKEGVVGTLVTNNEYAIEIKKLVVLQTTAASAGTYTYYASASTEKKSQRIILRALTIPAIVQPLLSKKAAVGKTAEMVCMARGNQSPRIDWFKVDENGNQVRMQTDNRITIEERNVDGDTQGIMMIKNVQKEDESHYACKAYNKATEILGSATIPETKSNLDVQTIPTIGEFQDTVNGQYQGREGASVTMKCEVRGDPRPVVVWAKVGSNHQYTEGQNSETVSVTKEDIADPNNPGVRLSLGLKGLEASAFGNYTCTARNEAGEVSKNVKLEVLFSPNFDGQDTDYGRVFYTWKGNTDGYFGKVACVANGNPPPVFNWYKDGTEIVNGTSGYGLSEEKSTDPRYPYRHISKLSVSYNGANDNIFGTYTCRATNNIKPNNQTLQLKRAEVPGMPVVTIQEEKPTVLTFWLMEPNVEGPEVTHFKVTYKLTGGPSEPVELIIPKEFRDYIDVNKKYTVAIINQLEPNKDYTFNFFAENNVGIGVGNEMNKRTPPISNVSRPCDSNGEWQYLQYNCLRADVSNAVNQTYSLTGNVTSAEVIKALSAVANVTEYKENRTSSELLNTTEISALVNALDLVAGLVSRHGIATYDVAKVFLKSASNILDMENKDTWLSLKQANKNTSETLLSSIDEFGSGLRKRIAAEVIGNVVIVNKNCVVEVKKVTDGIVKFPDNQTIQNDNQGDNTWIVQSKSRISLNTTALGEVAVTIVIYKDMNGIIFSRTSSNRSSHKEVIINGPIISVSISDNSTKLVSPIHMTFEHGQKNFTNATCNFWMFRREQLGYWDNDGCKVQTSNDTITVCECYHLTNFAVLMSPFVEADENTRGIRIVSIVGISVSSLCLILTIIVFARLWRYVRSDRSILLLNLITALIISYGIFIGGIDRTENKIVCTVVAAALHYIYSAVFCLMLAESIGILSDVILVFAQTSQLRKLLVFAWGVPVIIVGSALSITKTNGYGDDHYCWLSLSRGLRWAFVGPALFVILFNSIVLIILFKKMFALKSMEDKPVKDKIKTTLWSLCVLVPLMGISWILGIFYVNESASFMQYVFAVCNGLQGVYIFVCNCVLNEKVKDGFKKEKIRRFNKSI